MVGPRCEGMPGTDVDADTLNCPGEWAQGDGSDRAGSPSFNQTTGTFTGTPRVDDAGTVTVRVTAHADTEIWYATPTSGACADDSGSPRDFDP